jgi:hypothetical protein
MKTSSNNLNLKNLNLSLFFEFVGGRNLMLKTGDGKIIKITNEQEENFYNEYSDQELSFLPKCFYTFDRKENSELNQLIMDFKEQIDFVIYEFVRDYDQNKINELFIDPNFNYTLEIFQNFKKKCEENIHLKTDSENLKILKENFSKFSQEKLRYFLYYFIYKLQDCMHKSKFIIIEDLTYGMQRPCLIDIKLGYVYGKLENNYAQWVSDAVRDFGLRLMGTQVIYF